MMKPAMAQAIFERLLMVFPVRSCEGTGMAVPIPSRGAALEAFPRHLSTE